MRISEFGLLSPVHATKNNEEPSSLDPRKPLGTISAMIRKAQYRVAWLLVLFGVTLATVAEVKVAVDPAIRYQRIEGWGASVCWWANMVGGWSDEQVNEICDWITSPAGLNMNIFRFNIGGGDAPAHNHMRKDGGAMPGYRPKAGGPYDWQADANQRKILLKLKEKRPDAIFEAFANSPPWWMTKSGCASGNTDGSNNLKEDCYGDFADYLTEVVKFYKEKHGVVFRTMAPMNEPDANWWTAMKNQEGCCFTVDKQIQIITEVHKQLTGKGLINFSKPSAMDANNMDHCLTALKGAEGYVGQNIMARIGQINTHSYFGSKRKELAALATQQQKRLWQSESGPLHVKASGLTNHLHMAQRIITDLREMKANAWLDWQIISQNDPHWGLITANYSAKTYHKAKSYFVRSQFSRFIRPGYTIINSSAGNSLATLSASSDVLTVVICNSATSEVHNLMDLSRFRNVRGPAAVFRTSAKEDCQTVGPTAVTNKILQLNLPPLSVTTVIVGVM